MKVLIIKLNYQYIIQVYTIHQSYYQTVPFKHIVRLMRCFHRNFFTHFLRFWCCNNLAMRKVICKKKSTIRHVWGLTSIWVACLSYNESMGNSCLWLGRLISQSQSTTIYSHLYTLRLITHGCLLKKSFLFGMQKVNCCIIYITFLRYLQWKMDVWVCDCIKTINLLKCHRFAETLSSVKFQEPVNFSFRDISSQWQGHSPRHRNS